MKHSPMLSREGHVTLAQFSGCKNDAACTLHFCIPEILSNPCPGFFVSDLLARAWSLGGPDFMSYFPSWLYFLLALLVIMLAARRHHHQKMDMLTIRDVRTKAFVIYFS